MLARSMSFTGPAALSPLSAAVAPHPAAIPSGGYAVLSLGKPQEAASPNPTPPFDEIGMARNA